MLHREKILLSGVFAATALVLPGAAGAGSPPPVMLHAPVQQSRSLFGYSIGLSGDRIAVGAAFDSGSFSKAGIVHVYEFRRGQWIHVDAVQPQDPSTNAWFGTLALQGNRLLVGASRKSGGLGSAYIFDRVGGVWQQRAKFDPLDPVTSCNDPVYGCHLFGNAVALDGDTAVVGAPTEKIRIGAAYVYTRNPSSGAWSLQQRLQPNDPVEQTQFGNSVALHGNTVVVGAHFRTVGANLYQGAAYVFERNQQGVWSQTARLVASDGSTDDIFGFDVAIDANTILVGARLADLPGQPHRGAAYVFERGSGNWPQTARLDASDGVGVSGTDGDHFGYRVSLRGDEAWITRHPGDGNVPAPDTNGAVYRFVPKAGVWTETTHLTPANGSPGDSYGVSVDFNPSWLAVGAQYEGTPPDEVEKRGTVYVYERLPGDRIFADGCEVFG